MSDAVYKIKKTTLDNIANAIRRRTGKEETFALSDIPKEILSISSDGVFNFTIVGATSAPTNPTENTIWINTSTAISEYQFRPNFPETPIKQAKKATSTYIFHANTTTLTTQSVGRTAIFECLPNTKYTITKDGGNLWYIATSQLAAADGVAITILKSVEDSGSIIEIETGSNANYLYVFVSNASQEPNVTITHFIADNNRADGTALQAGDIWIKTGSNGNVEINASLVNGLFIYPQSCKQWDGSQWVSKEVKVYKNNSWQALKFWFLQGSNQYNEATGGWTVIDTPNGAHQAATVNGNGITFTTSANISREIATVQPIDFTAIDTLYFSIPSIANSSGSTRTFSLGVNPTRVHSWTYNNAQGWAVEKFVQNPANATNLLYSLDTRGLSGNHYILAATHCAGSTTLTLVIDEIYGV